jgi:hypothetical protein
MAAEARGVKARRPPRTRIGRATRETGELGEVFAWLMLLKDRAHVSKDQIRFSYRPSKKLMDNLAAERWNGTCPPDPP